MLLERRALLEAELSKAISAAAAEYLLIITAGSTAERHYKYSAIQDKVNTIEYDLRIVNELIKSGHQ